MSGVSEFINEAGSAHRVVVEKTRQLAGKWEKSGLLEGLTGHEKQGMAVMLENQATQLLSEQQPQIQVVQAQLVKTGQVSHFH